MERVVHQQIDIYLEEHDLLSRWQYGFRSENSNLDAITELTSHINNALKRGASQNLLSLNMEIIC